METNFQISLNFKSTKGLSTVGCFFVGNDRSFAEKIFKALKGVAHSKKTTVLCMELACGLDEMSLPIAIKYCTLEQLAHNIELLTKELFKRYSLECNP